MPRRLTAALIRSAATRRRFVLAALPVIGGLALVTSAASPVAASPVAASPVARVASRFPAARPGAGSRAASAPRVALTAPRAGAVSGVVSVSAAASHPAGIIKVIFLADGARVGEDFTAPYSVAWDTRRFADRRWALRAVAISRAGTHAYSVPVAAQVGGRPTGQAELERQWIAPAAGPFGPASVWRRDISRAPLAPDSAAQVADLARQVQTHWGAVAAFNVRRYTTSVAVVGATQPRARVSFDDCQHKGYVPRGLHGPSGQFEGVPIPPTAVPSAGTDSELTVYSPGTDQVWEFWKARHDALDWHACWGGRIDHASTSPGIFSGNFGATATGLPNAAGMISIRDARAGRIDHALSLQVIDAAKWNQFSYPAQRSDGSGAGPIREGARLRLDPSLDVASLHLSPLAAMVARAAQRYGFIVTDKGGAVAVQGESSGGLVAHGGSDPWRALLGSTPTYAVMKGFPWDRLQVLPTDWGKPGR